ncbi:ethanolamine utilization protein [Hypoxylon rubiginosum]|uniref:Ethanolamine utilization protein n=1 Tax=Hypoxylon rubiginosum TaxID=110542 RepID=A0ACB9YHQ0_9PEZI|nr:ethanolamine utilization protein [Hypoxylon rubiginosum]
MVFEHKSEREFYRVPKLEGAPPPVHFVDVFSTAEKGVPNPLTGSMFLLEYAATAEPAPHYDYDESGVVIKGTLVIEDEKGNKATLQEGDTFFIHRGSDITFSSPKFAIAFKVASRTKIEH